MRTWFHTQVAACVLPRSMDHTALPAECESPSRFAPAVAVAAAAWLLLLLPPPPLLMLPLLGGQRRFIAAAGPQDAVSSGPTRQLTSDRGGAVSACCCDGCLCDGLRFGALSNAHACVTRPRRFDANAAAICSSRPDPVSENQGCTCNPAAAQHLQGVSGGSEAPDQVVPTTCRGWCVVYWIDEVFVPSRGHCGLCMPAPVTVGTLIGTSWGFGQQRARQARTSHIRYGTVQHQSFSLE